jgi:hypothetical protein
MCPLTVEQMAPYTMTVLLLALLLVFGICTLFGAALCILEYACPVQAKLDDEVKYL